VLSCLDAAKERRGKQKQPPTVLPVAADMVLLLLACMLYLCVWRCFQKLMHGFACAQGLLNSSGAERDAVVGHLQVFLQALQACCLRKGQKSSKQSIP
jgi:hypothetical protein